MAGSGLGWTGLLIRVSAGDEAVAITAVEECDGVRRLALASAPSVEMSAPRARLGSSTGGEQGLEDDIPLRVWAEGSEVKTLFNDRLIS